MRDLVIQRILRLANVSATATYYIKTAAEDVKCAMEQLENNISQTELTVRDTYGTLKAREQETEQSIQ